MPPSHTRRLLLINPKQRIRHYSVQFGLARLVGRRSIMPSLGLPTLAAHTPPGWRVEIVDEETRSIPFGAKADLVGIASLTNTVTNAYAIADRFRAAGIPVVLGGPHVSYAVEEGLEHADAVVAGEAEPVWAQLIGDLEAGVLKKVYRADEPFALHTQRPPRWDLVATRNYVSLPVQASRGCPYNCDFCLVTRMFGRAMRFRPVEDVVAEVRALPLKRVFFVDDNLTINRTFARELLQQLAPLGISWSCQASMDIADDPELIELMATAGCGQVLIGFESLNPQSIAETRKHQNMMERYEKVVSTVHGAGMQIIGSFIIGFDHDTTAELDRIAEFCNRLGLCFVSINILGANPGTVLHSTLAESGRVCNVPRDWRGGMLPVLHYMRMSQRELFEAFVGTLQQFYSPEQLLGRARKLFATGAFARHHADSDVSVWRKILTSVLLLRMYVLTPSRARRALFFWLIRQARNGKVSVERAVFFLLSMSGFQNNVARFAARRTEFLGLIDQFDAGPWAERPDGHATAGTSARAEHRHS